MLGSTSPFHLNTPRSACLEINFNIIHSFFVGLKKGSCQVTNQDPPVPAGTNQDPPVIAGTNQDQPVPAVTNQHPQALRVQKMRPEFRWNSQVLILK